MPKTKYVTEKQIEQMEKNSYVIQIANEFYSKNGTYSFSISQAEKYYSVILDNILYALENGDPKQQQAAERCLVRLHILPLKIQ